MVGKSRAEMKTPRRTGRLERLPWQGLSGLFQGLSLGVCNDLQRKIARQGKLLVEFPVQFHFFLVCHKSPHIFCGPCLDRVLLPSGVSLLLCVEVFHRFLIGAVLIFIQFYQNLVYFFLVFFIHCDGQSIQIGTALTGIDRHVFVGKITSRRKCLNYS